MSTLLQVAKQLGVHHSLLRFGSTVPGALPDVILMKVSDRSIYTSSKTPISSQPSRPVVPSTPQQVRVKITERPASQTYFPPGKLSPHDVPPKPKKSETIFGSDEYPYHQINKRMIPELFAKYLPGVNPLPYQAAAEVFPMRVNNYVVENHVKWSKGVDDEYLKLVIPSPYMLTTEVLAELMAAITLRDLARNRKEKSAATFKILDIVTKYQNDFMNAHPAGQSENKPKLNGEELQGIQHKYAETVLWFASEAQFCHAFCTYCFRWRQFAGVGSGDQFKNNDPNTLFQYVSRHKQIKDVLLTGGDPMVMTVDNLRKYIEPLLNNTDTDHLQTIRIGTKSLAYWPRKFTTDKDAKDVLALFRKIVDSGKTLSIQAHFTHPRELDTPEVKEAIKAIRATGANIRCQSPIVRGINDSSEVWSEMWNKQLKLGMIPYYMFIERDTGAKEYFEIPLAKAFRIYNETYTNLSGIGRPATGPSMSAMPGKVQILDILEDEDGNKTDFLCRFVQARHPKWAGKTFLAKYSETATWLDGPNGLRPSNGKEKFFWEDELAALMKSEEGSSGQWKVTNDRWKTPSATKPITEATTETNVEVNAKADAALGVANISALNADYIAELNAEKQHGAAGL